MADVGRWKTKKLDCWQKCKETRIGHYKKIQKSREPGSKILFSSGSGGTPVNLFAGFGDFVYLEGEPYAASQSWDWEKALPCLEEVERRGWARDLCGYMRNYWGAMYLDKFLFGGPWPKPDFIFSVSFCDSHAKWYQVVVDYEKVPIFVIDYPISPEKQRYEAKIDHLTNQFLDGIEWMEKITGKKYNDEAFIKATENIIEACSIWTDLMCYNKSIPAPVDQKSIYTLYIMNALLGYTDEGLAFCKEIRDEIKYRAENQIAADAHERFRVFDDSQPPWHTLRFFRYLQKYGCVDIGSPYSINLFGLSQENPDGTWSAVKTLKERGIELKTREDACRQTAIYVFQKYQYLFMIPWERSRVFVSMAKDWNLDGVLIHLNRGCEGFGLGQMECRQELIKAKMPVLTFEGNMGDKREFDEAQTYKRVDTFFERFNLKQLDI